MEKTLIIIKPDGIQKKLLGEILKRIEEKELRIFKIKQIKLDENMCVSLYGDSMERFPHIKQPIIDYMTEEEVIVAIIEGEEAIRKAREVRGLSDPSKSPVGSVRRDFAGENRMEELTAKGMVTKNIMHSSGSLEEVDVEIKLFFREHEI